MNNKELEKHIEDLTKQLEQAKNKLVGNKQRKVFSANFEWRFLPVGDIQRLRTYLHDKRYASCVSISETGYGTYTIEANCYMTPEQLAELAEFVDNM